MIPLRSVLAAVDFSDASRVALGFAARLARHSAADLHVLHVEDPLLVAAAGSSGIDLSRETGDELAAFVRATGLPPDGPDLHCHIVAGAATPTICGVAAREGASVIVMGMHGMSGAARAVFGSTTERVLRQAETSILAVPAGWTPPDATSPDLSGTGPVVAAVDDTEPSWTGARSACRLAAMLGAPVELLHVVPAPSVLARWRAHAEAALQQRVEAARGELSARLPQLDATVPVSLRVESGSVADTIAAAVAPAEGRHPVLVLGRRDRASREGAPGATAYRVLSLVQVPVLVHVPEA